MKHWYIILPFDYTDSEQSSGQTICIKNARTPPCDQWILSHRKVNIEYVYTFTLLLTQYIILFSVKKGQFICLFWTEWLEIQATQRMVYIIKETHYGMFAFKSYCWVLDSKQIHLIWSNDKWCDIPEHNFLWGVSIWSVRTALQTCPC